MDGQSLIAYSGSIAPALGPRFDQSLLDFFLGRIRNENTRIAYAHNIRAFFRWMKLRGLQLDSMTPAHIGLYVENYPGSIPTRLQHLSAIKSFYNHMQSENLVSHNPAHIVKGPAFSRIEGATPALDIRELRLVVRSIESDTIVGLRDRALITDLYFTFGRITASLDKTVGSFIWKDGGSSLSLAEKRGLHHELPVHPIMEDAVRTYLKAARLTDPAAPVYQSVRGRSQTLLGTSMSRFDAYRMIRRRTARVGLPPLYGCHTMRATGITNFLENEGSLEKAAEMAGQRNTSTTKLYDRRRVRSLRREFQRLEF